MAVPAAARRRGAVSLRGLLRTARHASVLACACLNRYPRFPRLRRSSRLTALWLGPSNSAISCWLLPRRRLGGSRDRPRRCSRRARNPNLLEKIAARNVTAGTLFLVGSVGHRYLLKPGLHIINNNITHSCWRLTEISGQFFCIERVRIYSQSRCVKRGRSHRRHVRRNHQQRLAPDCSLRSPPTVLPSACDGPRAGRAGDHKNSAFLFFATI